MLTDRQELYRHNREWGFTARIPEEGCVVIYRDEDRQNGMKTQQYFISFDSNDKFREASGEGYVYDNFADFLKNIEAVIPDAASTVQRQRQIREWALRRASRADEGSEGLRAPADDPEHLSAS